MDEVAYLRVRSSNLPSLEQSKSRVFPGFVFLFSFSFQVQNEETVAVAVGVDVLNGIKVSEKVLTRKLGKIIV